MITHRAGEPSDSSFAHLVGSVRDLKPSSAAPHLGRHSVRQLCWLASDSSFAHFVGSVSSSGPREVAASWLDFRL